MLCGPAVWYRGVAFAMVLEAAMLLTPYPAVFGIQVGAAFVAVTLAAHAVFGWVMGITAARGQLTPASH